jgi:hypothetical protein
VALHTDSQKRRGLSKLNIQAVSATMSKKCKILGDASAQCQELKYKTPKSINKYIIHAKRIIL